MEASTIVDLARSQHGLISKAQADAAGLTARMIQRRVNNGSWDRAQRGVYVIGGAPPSWEQRILAGCLAAGPDASASHRSSGRLWGVVQASGRPELVVAGTRSVVVPGFQIHQSILLPALDRTSRRGVPCTSLTRTLADLSSHQDPRTVGGWIDQAMRAEGLSLLDLRSCIARLSGPGRRDLQPVRTALASRLPGYDPGDSELEIRALRALHDAGLPAPVQQHSVRRADGRRARIDLAYPVEMVAIELDGWDHHGRRSAFDPDRIRRNELTLLGWRVYQFTASMSDDLLISTVAAALAQALTPAPAS